MAKNDKVLLDGIVDDRIEQVLPSTRRDEVFEYLAFEQILKDLDLSREEIENGIVDGRNDGGIDGFFILVNGTYLADPESFIWPRTGSELEVWVITCKHHDTFQQAPLDNLAASLSELLDFGLESNEFKGDYSEQVKKYRENLKLAYRKLSPRMNKFTIHFSYASRGDTSDIGESVVSRAEHIKSIAKESFSTCLATFTFYGSSELVDLHRKIPNFSLELPFLEILSKGERYILLASLREYYRFITDEGKLRRYLFDSNVRDFMGLNRVNEDIKATLDNSNSPDFWWLNNGITILTTKAVVVGKSIQLEDIQIVNGLQTTQSIFSYFEAGGTDSNERSVLIKVIVSSVDSVRDAIIRATNNQTNVELSSLHATDKIQRDIEEILERNGLFYERRKNFYINLGHSPSEIITPLYLASGYVSLVLKSPQKATLLKNKFMRSMESYNTVFTTKIPIDVWPIIVKLLRKTDFALENLRPKGSRANERFLRNWRHITSLLTLSKLIGDFDYSVNDLIQFDIAKFTDEEINSTWEFMYSFEPKSVSNVGWRNKDFILRLYDAFSKEFQVKNMERIEKTRLDTGYERRVNTTKVDMDFALKVHELLPPQPWKPGVHNIATKALQCTFQEYSSAVQMLIDEGLRNRQKDGIVYDADGNVISFDPERVVADSMKLKPKTDA
jgi:hypothetical protein